ncbi:MAG: helix-turn-helix domain-containing protein [Clostridiales bacterium]|nr:helix-turn-helix domain-containing protein [Clostridiales bacterium]
MKIGKIIRKYRKEKEMSQEEMALRLGVSTAAVNKWENDHSYPDITLLSPIARLLNLSLDDLLSFQEDLSEKEVYQYVEELNQMIKQNSFAAAYEWSKDKVKEFPSCYLLIVRIAAVLDADRLFKEESLPDGFDEYIESLYQRALKSTDENIRLIAANALIDYYIRKGNYEEAECCLEYYSPQNPEKKRKQAQLYFETQQDEKAYKCYEEMLYAEYLQVSRLLHGIYMLAFRNKNFDKAHLIADKQTELAELFDMGRYQEVSSHLELAAFEKDEAATIRIVKEMLGNLDSLFSFRESSLYEHMTFKEADASYLNEIRDNLKKEFAEEESFRFLSDNPEWKRIIA